MSNSIQDIADHLRAANFEHVRAIIEPDDNMVLIDYLEGQGFISVEARARNEADAAIQAASEAEDAEIFAAPQTSESAVDFESMTNDELLEYAESLSVEVAKSKTKAEIIEAIESENK